METYIPDAPGGLLGGCAAGVEMDDIQVWKREEGSSQYDAGRQGELQMDEIQLFKMLLERKVDESHKQEVDLAENAFASASCE